MTRIDQPLVAITGSSGLIGSRLIEALRDDYRLVGMDLKEPEGAAAEVPWIKCDLTDDGSVRAALAQLRNEHGEQIASVVHLAAYYDFSGEPSPLYRELTVEGTKRLLLGLQSFEVEQFIFSSTLLVMKSSDEDKPVTAESPVDAEWDYPQSKLATEKLIQELRGDTPALVLRIAGVYDEDCHSVPVAQQISRIHQKKLESYFFPGDKTHGQSFVHLDDLVACFSAAIARRGELPPYEVLLIGEEDVMSYEELQDRLGELIHGQEWPAIRIPKAAAKAGAWVQDKMASSEEDAPFIKPWMIDLADQNYPVDIERARQTLGWTPRHSLRHTIPEIVSRLRDNPSQWYEMNGLPVPRDVGEPQGSRR
ncbi:MAG: NAD(P)-dependent oxidoreductase [Planctomycetota bacterium]|nr:MAG: NAD(P)-dependent oxidoreductase [Planctomycetota bacterium]